MKIGIFDSGKGGTTVMSAIQMLLPGAEYKYIGDSKNCPYGEKSDEDLMRIVRGHVDDLKNWGAKIIVIACNTATTRCIEKLRREYPELDFVGTEPAVKLAIDSGAKKVLVMATPGTVHSERLAHLLESSENNNQTIDLLACAGLADAIESNSRIKETLGSILVNTSNDYDVVVLGCTHYSLIKDVIQKYFEQAKLIDGNNGVARQVFKIATY